MGSPTGIGAIVVHVDATIERLDYEEVIDNGGWLRLTYWRSGRVGAGPCGNTVWAIPLGSEAQPRTQLRVAQPDCLASVQMVGLFVFEEAYVQGSESGSQSRKRSQGRS